MKMESCAEGCHAGEFYAGECNANDCSVMQGCVIKMYCYASKCYKHFELKEMV